MRSGMEDQGKFLEMLQEIKEIAAAQQNKMTREEVGRYLGNGSLSEEQMRAVYQYLGENGIAVEGYQYIPVAEEPLEEGSSTDIQKRDGVSGRALAGTQGKTVTKAKENLRMYEREISEIAGKLEQEEERIVSFLRGEDSLRDSLVEMRLAKVVELAEKYEGHALPREEIIAEGNMGLMVGMRIVEQNWGDFLRADGTLDREKFFGTLDMEVVHAMENYIDGEDASKDWEHAMLAKANLLHEAMKYLAEDMGRVPDVGELSEYTKIEPEEIRRIMDLSRDGK